MKVSYSFKQKGSDRGLSTDQTDYGPLAVKRPLALVAEVRWSFRWSLLRFVVCCSNRVFWVHCPLFLLSYLLSYFLTIVIVTKLVGLFYLFF